MSRALCDVLEFSHGDKNAKLVKGHDADPGSRLGKIVRIYRLK